jgi:germination protein M
VSARGTAASLAVLAALAGCGESERESQSSQAAAPRTQQAVVYLLRGQKVAPLARRVPATRGVAAAAMRALLRGPTSAEREAGYSSAIPPGTRLAGVNVRDGLATVDLGRRFESGGGSQSMTARVAQVVHTLTRFPTVRRVAFRLDGRAVDTIGGEGIVVDPPVDRRDFERVAPAILVESPLRGQRVRSPLRVRGTANTFEATLLVEMLGPNRRRLARRVVTATSGTGTRGTFDVTLRFRARRGTALELYAYEESARNGRPINRIRIPLRR